MKRKIISIFCAFLTIISFFGGTPISTEAASTAFTIWKECSSVDELAAYMQDKCDEASKSDTYWKNIKIISRADNKVGDATTAHDPTNLTSGSYYEFCLSNFTPTGSYLLEHWFVISKLAEGTSSSLVAASKVIEPNHYESNWAVFSTNWFGSSDTVTLNNKYLVTSTSVENDKYTTKIRATSTEAKDVYRQSSKSQGIGAVVKKYSVQFSNRTTFQFEWSFMDEYKDFMKVQCENNGNAEKACFGMNTSTISGHTYFNLVGQSSSDGLYTDYHINAAGVTTILSETQDPIPTTPNISNLFGIYGQNYLGSDTNWFMIYLPVDSNVCYMMAATEGNTDANWTENWDWEKYYKSMESTRLSQYREVSGSISVSADTTTIFTGTTYIKPGATLDIPSGATVIIASNSALLIDGVINNQGTLIIESGAMVSYLRHDMENYSSMIKYLAVTNYSGSFPEERYLNNLRGAYVSMYSDYVKILGIGTSASRTMGATKDYSKLSQELKWYPWAVYNNGIDNQGYFIVRKDARVDIPRFTQNSDGETWLYGTMTVEEVLHIGTEETLSIDQDTSETWRSTQNYDVYGSNGVKNADYSLNIDGGKLYVCQNSTITNNGTSYDNHIGLWVLPASEWGNTLTINTDVWTSDRTIDKEVSVYPLDVSFGTGVNVYDTDSSQAVWDAIIVPSQMETHFHN